MARLRTQTKPWQYATNATQGCIRTWWASSRAKVQFAQRAGSTNLAGGACACLQQPRCVSNARQGSSRTCRRRTSARCVLLERHRRPWYKPIASTARPEQTAQAQEWCVVAVHTVKSAQVASLALAARWILPVHPARRASTRTRRGRKAARRARRGRSPPKRASSTVRPRSAQRESSRLVAPEQTAPAPQHDSSARRAS